MQTAGAPSGNRRVTDRLEGKLRRAGCCSAGCVRLSFFISEVAQEVEQHSIGEVESSELRRRGDSSAGVGAKSKKSKLSAP